jgi:heat shock protein HslJ
VSSLRRSDVLASLHADEAGRISRVFGVASFLLFKRLVLKQSPFVVLFLLAVAGSSACSTSPSTPTGPSSSAGSTNLTAGQIGGTWTLTSIQPADRAEQAAPASAIYTVTLDGERISSRVDCNRCSGQMKLDGSTLTLGPALACTRAACPTMEYESAFLSVLGGESQAHAESNTLTLSSSRGLLRFRR